MICITADRVLILKSGLLVLYQIYMCPNKNLYPRQDVLLTFSNLLDKRDTASPSFDLCTIHSIFLHGSKDLHWLQFINFCKTCNTICLSWFIYFSIIKEIYMQIYKLDYGGPTIMGHPQLWNLFIFTTYLNSSLCRFFKRKEKLQANPYNGLYVFHQCN